MLEEGLSTELVEDWYINLSPWILSDGNYPKLKRGQEAEFAFEFHPQSIKQTVPGERFIRHIMACQYEIAGEVIYREHDFWVLDVGIGIFNDAEPPQEVEVGSFTTGTVSLGVDPFFYFETHAKKEAVPPLIYSWKINRIVQETAPLVKASDVVMYGVNYKEMLIPDASRLNYAEVEETEPKYSLGTLEFILLCTKLDVAAKRTSVTAL